MKNTFFYSVPEVDGNKIFEFSWNSVCAYFLDDDQDGDVIATKAAEDFYFTRGGHAVEWPLTFRLRATPSSRDVLEYSVGAEQIVNFHVQQVS